MCVNKDKVRVLCNDPELVEQLRTQLADQLSPGQVFCEARDCEDAPLCRWLGATQLGEAGRIQAALHEVIEMLQSTRHAFKSKAVAEARMRLRSLMRELSEQL